MRTWSFSAVETYEKCPYAWKRRYVDGIRGEPSEAMKIGQETEFLINEILQDRYFEKILDTPLVDSAMEEFFQRDFGSLEKSQWKLTADFSYDDGVVIPFVGIVDFLFDMDDHYALVDYKTCKEYSSWTQGKADKHGQVAIYRDMSTEILNKPVKGYYVATNKKDYRTRTLPVETKNNMLTRLRKVYNSVLEEVYEPTPNRLCPWCDHYDHCKEKKYCK